VADRAALHGLLNKVRDLGTSLIFVDPVKPGSSIALGTGQANAPDFKHQYETHHYRYERETQT
jgi:hypothetical protein